MKQALRDGLVFPADDDHFHGKVTEYQKAVFDMAMGYVDDIDHQCTAIDAGAHVGIFTRRMRVFSEVLAFEPDPVNYACLVENTAMFPNVKPIHAALGRTNGWGCVQVDYQPNSGARSFVPLNDGEIRVFPIDLFLTSPVKLIKIDTQGAEHDILLGANMLLRRDKPVLIVEMPDTDTTIYLCNMGYLPVGRVNKDQVFARRD